MGHVSATPAPAEKASSWVPAPPGKASAKVFKSVSSHSHAMPAARLLPTLVVLVLLVLAGCVVPATPGAVPEETPRARPLASSADASEPGFGARTGGDALTVDVPVPVILVGFPAGFTDRLAPHLDARPVAHAVVDSGVTLPEQRPDRRLPHPLVPTPRYDVRPLSGEATATFFQRLQAEATVAPGLYDAVQAERILADVLADEGLAPPPEAPSLVLLHSAPFLPSHAYRQTYPAGALDEVRFFGEREPFLVMDVSARRDPWVVQGAPYEIPLNLDGRSAPATVALLLRDLVEFRLLQGPVFDVPTERCHGVTVLGLSRPTSSGNVPSFVSAFGRLDKEGVRNAFVNLTRGHEVHVDLRLLLLPVDDPALHAVAATRQMETIRWWITTHWEDYWVPHEGCEAYVSVLIDGDLVDPTGGLATYHVEHDRRISLSLASDWDRLCEVYRYCVDPNPGRWEYPNLLVTHETGHLFGQGHPHDVTLADGTYVEKWAFSSGYTAMSYQPGDALWDFGAIDRNNWARNRVASLYVDAGGDAIPDEEVAPVLAAMAVQDWDEAARLLEEFKSRA